MQSQTMADLTLKEEDIPGAKLDVTVPALQKKKCSDLKFWLSCRGDSCKGLKTKAQMIERIQLIVRNGDQFPIVDPTSNKQWTKNKAEKQIPCSRPCITHGADPTGIPQQGCYHQWGNASDWGRNLCSLPALTRREIDLHVDLANMKSRPQKESTRVSKPAIRGAHFKAERYLSAGSIFTRSDNNFFYCKAICLASMKSCSRKLSVAIRFLDANIVHAHCDCPAGLGGVCNHMHALLFELASYHLHGLKAVPEEVACTSRLSQWVVPRCKGTVDKQPVMDVTVKRLKVDEMTTGRGIESTLYDARVPYCRINDNEKLTEFQQSVQEMCPSIPFSYLAKEEDETTLYKNTRFGPAPLGSPVSYQCSIFEFHFQVYSNFPERCSFNAQPSGTGPDLSYYPSFPLTTVPIYNINYVPASQLESDFYSFIQQIDPVQIENETREQSSCAKWFNHRQFRFTASKFHSILLRKKLDCKFAEGFLPGEEKPVSDFLKKKFKHGNDFEPVAANKYSQYMNGSGHAVRLEKCGLVIDPKACWLGASPDRKVVDYLAESPFGILEIKCPEKQKDEDPLTACHDPHFCCKLEGGKPVLKKDHPYYTQVQGQLALTGAEWCDFVVYTHKGLIIQRISFDPAFWNTLYQKLADVYFGFYITVASVKFQSMSS